MEIDSCNPNCAQGTYAAYAASVMLSDLPPFGSGRKAYADMIVSAPTSPNSPQSHTNLLPR